MKSRLEELLAWQMKTAEIPAPVREHRFHETRKFRFDFAWPDRKLAVEVEGGIYGRGRHTRPRGFTNDCTKYNLAAAAGWTVLRFTPGMVRDLTALHVIMKELAP